MDASINMFAELEHIDAHRAVWSLFKGSDEVEPSLKRLLSATKLYIDMYYERSIRDPTIFEGLEVFGCALWQVSCHISRDLSPSPPPPPYTLFAFNIELPEIVLRRPTARRSIMEPTKQSTKRKRTYVDDVEHVRKQRLVRFEINGRKAASTRRLLSPAEPTPLLALPTVDRRMDVDGETCIVAAESDAAELMDVVENAKALLLLASGKE